MVRPNLFEILTISAWGLCVLPLVVSQAAPPAPSPTMDVTHDGTCGKGLTCLGSGLGECCSGHGFCGNGDAYCGTGCNPMFGTCYANNTIIPATTIHACAPVNKTVTATVVSVSVATSAATVTAFATTTQISTAVATSVVTSVSKSISLYTLTSTRLVYTKSISVYTTVSTATVKSTSVVVSVSTKTVSAVSTVTVTATVQVPSPVTQTVGTSTTGAAPAPSPTLIGTSSDCKKYYEVKDGDTCDTISRREKITLLKFHHGPPQLQPQAQTGIVGQQVSQSPRFNPRLSLIHPSYAELTNHGSIAAIGLAGNIISFLDFGYNVLSKAKEIRASESGASAANLALASVTTRLRDVVLSLPATISTSTARSQNQSLENLGAECQQISNDLLKLLDDVRLGHSRSARSALRAALREVSGKKKEQLRELEKRLDRCRQQLILELLDFSRFETYERLSKLVETGQSSQDELVSLSKGVQSLQSGVRVTCLDPAAVVQIRSLLDLSDKAVGKVRECRVLEALRFDLMEERFYNVKEAHEQTFDWIFGVGNQYSNYRSDEMQRCMGKASSDFITWLEHGDGIFHVAGKPGSGKSTLMKYLCRNWNTQRLLELWAGDKTLVLSKFFFWRPGTELQRSLPGLIRGLLFCLLSNSPDLVSIAFPEQWEQARLREKVYVDQNQIDQAFNTVISTQKSLRNHKFALFIDGLDEFTGNHAELIRQLFEWTGRTKDIKICVSSREWTIFQVKFSSCPQMKLHELTREDIEKVVKSRFDEAGMASMLEEAGCGPDDMKQSIVAKSEGVFLWVTVALQLVEDGLMNGDLQEDLRRKIDCLPTELEVMFRHLLDSIPPEDRKLAYLILSFALQVSTTDGKHCCLIQYSFLEDYLIDRNFAIALPAKPIDRSAISIRLSRAKRRAYGICRGFLGLLPYSTAGSGEAQPTFVSQMTHEEAERETNGLFGGALKFTHRSVVEFLKGKYARQQIDDVLAGVDVFDAWCQTFLAVVKAISMHQTGLCYPDEASRSKQSLILDFRAQIDLSRTVVTKSSRASNLLPAWFGDILIDISKVAAERDGLDMGQFDNFINCVSDAVKSLGLPPRRIHLVDAGIQIFRCDRYIEPDLADVPSLVVAGWGPPLSKNTLAPSIRLWMLLNVLEDASHFGKRLTAFNGVQNLKLYLSAYRTPNESSTISGVPRWHFYLWTCCWARPTLPAIALFLYYGANPRFWIISNPDEGGFYFHFESEPGGLRATNDGEPEETPSTRVVSYWSNRRQEDYYPWGKKPAYSSKEYQEFWKRHDHKISFRDLVALWFPKHASVLQGVIDWIAQQGDQFSEEKLRELQKRFGACLQPLFDVDSLQGWQSVEDFRTPGDSGPDIMFGSMVPGEILYTGG